MSRFHRAVFSVLAVAVLVVATAATSFAAPSHSKSQATKLQLTIHITKASGIVWGKVTNNVNSKVCSKTTCTYKIAKGKKVKLTETPKDSTTWPFKDWKLNGKKKGSSATLSFKMSKAETAKAIYVFM